MKTNTACSVFINPRLRSISVFPLLLSFSGLVLCWVILTQSQSCNGCNDCKKDLPHLCRWIVSWLLAQRQKIRVLLWACNFSSSRWSLQEVRLSGLKVRAGIYTSGRVETGWTRGVFLVFCETMWGWWNRNSDQDCENFSTDCVSFAKKKKKNGRSNSLNSCRPSLVQKYAIRKSPLLLFN